MEKKTTTRKSSPRKSAQSAFASVVAGVAGILLAVWIIYGTVTVDPFRWGVFAEELIVALCALFALRLLCVIRLPKWLPIVCVILLPAAVLLYGLVPMPGDPASWIRVACVAAAAAFALLTAQQLDNKPDGVLLVALLIGVSLPVVLSAQTRMLDELMRALLMAGLFMCVLSIRHKSVWMAYLATAAFALAGGSSLSAAFAGLGAGVGALLLAPKRKRGVWVFAAVLMASLPVAAWFAARALLPQGSLLFLLNEASAGEFARLVRVHLLRALAVGLLALAARFFISREDAAIPLVLALGGCAVARLIPFAFAPDVWMDAFPLCVLAGVGVAKAAR